MRATVRTLSVSTHSWSVSELTDLVLTRCARRGVAADEQPAAYEQVWDHCFDEGAIERLRWTADFCRQVLRGVPESGEPDGLRHALGTVVADVEAILGCVGRDTLRAGESRDMTVRVYRDKQL